MGRKRKSPPPKFNTVGDLIKELSKYPPETLVKAEKFYDRSPNYCCNCEDQGTDMSSMEDEPIESIHSPTNYRNYVVITTYP